PRSRSCILRAEIDKGTGQGSGVAGEEAEADGCLDPRLRTEWNRFVEHLRFRIFVPLRKLLEHGHAKSVLFRIQLKAALGPFAERQASFGSCWTGISDFSGHRTSSPKRIDKLTIRAKNGVYQLARISQYLLGWR